MNLADVIALAKAGYKKRDIDELLSIEVPEEPKEETLEKEKEKVKEPEEVEDGEEPKIDYKKLYEESQAKLKEAQKKNVKEPVAEDDKADEDILAELVKGFRS